MVGQLSQNMFSVRDIDSLHKLPLKALIMNHPNNLIHCGEHVLVSSSEC